MFKNKSAKALVPTVVAAVLLGGPAMAQSPGPAYPVGSAKAASPTPPPAKASGPNAVSPVSPTIQQVRRQILKPDGNSFYFHNMDDLFDTRQVPRSGPVWPLPREDRDIAITYGWQGQSYGLDDMLDRTFTNALIVMKNGKIVTERYLNRTDASTHFMSWSMAKSFTSTMVGFALADGKIASLDDPITKYLPELKAGAYNGVTIRQVLEMKSGVDYEERYDFEHPGIAALNHEHALVQNTVRFTDAAWTIKRKHTPGATFEYKTIDTAVLGWLVERVADRPFAYYMAEKLWEPLGAEANGFFIMDGPPGAGREFTGAGFNAVARDYARFGQMILNKGQANGRQVMSPAWIAEATRPTGAEGPMGGYGYQWWTMTGSNAFYALGLEGQFIYIDPDTQTVVVKLSYFPPERDELYGETLEAMKALSAWKP
jgi:CubicO group peptidase (beta-lactamase class C family)